MAVVLKLLEQSELRVESYYLIFIQVSLLATNYLKYDKKSKNCNCCA